MTRFKSIGWEPQINLSNGIKKEIDAIENSLTNENDRGTSLKNFI